MAQVISFLNQKGGSGKTTLSTNVATALALKGRRVLVVDADPQGSALDFSAGRDGEPLFPVVGVPKPTLHRELAALKGDYEFVVIDGPPRSYDVSRSAILASDLALVPVQPSPYDVWAAEEIVGLIGEGTAFSDGLKYGFVINRRIVQTAIGRDVTEALATYPVPVLKSQLCQRVSFAESASVGRGVLEVDPGSPAAGEVRALVKEILGLLK